MKRDQIIEKLQKQVSAFQQLIDQLKQSDNSDFKAIELGLLENKLITFYDEILKIKADNSKATIVAAVPEPIKATEELKKAEVEENTDHHTNVETIKSEFENLKQQFKSESDSEQKPSITFEQPEKSEEDIDSELEGLMDIAAKEIKEQETQHKEEISESPIKSEERNIKAKEQASPKSKESINQNEAAAEKHFEPDPERKDIPKPASINDRLKKEQGQPSLLDKLASNKSKHGLSKQMAGKPIKDLKKAINLNLQIRFQKELFEGDKRAYRKAIDFINKCNTYSEARSYIQHELAEEFKNCKEGNPTFDELMGLVKRRFV